MKKCSRCKIEKSFDEFHKLKKGGEKLRSECKNCTSNDNKSRPKIINDKADILSKTCSKCKVDKKPEEFHKCSTSKSGFYNYCKNCSTQKTKEYNSNNPERIKELGKKYRKNNTEKVKSYNKHYKNKNRKHINEHLNLKRKNDINFRLRQNLSSRILTAIKLISGIKSASTIELLGCSVEEVRAYLENQFLPGMSWDNHSKHGWHIDHIRPCASFDLTDPEQQRQCFHYSNLQPLWCDKNWSKNSLWEGVLIRR